MNEAAINLLVTMGWDRRRAANRLARHFFDTDDLDKALAVFANVGEELGVINRP